MANTAKRDGFSREVGKPLLLSTVVRNPGSNWIHRGLCGKKSDLHGVGVFATQSLCAGESLIVYGGQIVTAHQLVCSKVEDEDCFLQIDSTLFLKPMSSPQRGVGELLNHSCNPNAGFRGTIHLVALREIAADEEITIDYATFISTSANAFLMECNCLSPDCRKVITGEDWQLKKLQSRLFDFFQPYLQHKIRERQKKRPWQR